MILVTAAAIAVLLFALRVVLLCAAGEGMMVDPLTQYAAGNLFASGSRNTGAGAVKSLFEASTAPAPQNDPYGLLAGAQAQAAGLNLQNQVAQGLRGPDGGLGRLATILNALDGFVAEGQAVLAPEARTDLQRKIDNLVEDFTAIAGNPQLTDPILLDETGLLDLAGLSVGSTSDAAAAKSQLNAATTRLADNAGSYAQKSELQQAQGTVFGALTGVSGLTGYDAEGGSIGSADARALIQNNAALGLLI